MISFNFRCRFHIFPILVSCLFLIAGSSIHVHAGGDVTRRDLTSLTAPYRDSVLRGWVVFQSSYADDGVACVHCHRDHGDMMPWAGAYPKVQLFDGTPYGVKTLRMVVLEALAKHTDVSRAETGRMAEDLMAYISWWGDGQPIIPGIAEAMPPPTEDLVELQNAVTRGRELFNRDKPLSCVYCHTTSNEKSSYRKDLSQCYSRFPKVNSEGTGTNSLHAYLADHRKRMGVFMGPDDIPELTAYLADLSRGLKLNPGGQTPLHEEPLDVENVD